MKNIIGIDPGKTGAVAALDARGDIFFIADLCDDAAHNASIMNMIVKNDSVFIERAHAMPKQGVTSSFNFGKAFGIVLGLSHHHSRNVSLVTARKWKQNMGLIGKDKEASCVLAIKLYPAASSLITLKKHHGRAEALLIAHWGRSFGGGQ